MMYITVVSVVFCLDVVDIVVVLDAAHNCRIILCCSCSCHCSYVCICWCMLLYCCIVVVVVVQL